MGQWAGGLLWRAAVATLATLALGNEAAHANSTPWDLKDQGTFEQEWNSGALLTADDDWSGVPSIEGFCGVNDVIVAGAHPTTALAPQAGDECVDVNETDPATKTPSGIAEFGGTWDTVALGPHDGADAPSLVVHMDTTGMTRIDVRVSFRDIDTSSRDSTAQVAVQYQDTPGGPFKTVDDRTDVSQQNDTFDPTDNVVLPASADDNPNLKVRLIVINSVGLDEWIGVDNIRISGDTAPPAGAFRIDSDLPRRIGPQNQYEVDEEAGTASVRVVRKGGAAGGVSVRFETLFGTGSVAGRDYTAIDRRLEFAPGETSKDVAIPIAGDPLLQGTRAITLQLSEPTGGASIPSISTTSIRILDDERPSAVVYEVDADPDGNDAVNAHEYIELRTHPGLTDFNYLNLVDVQGASGSAGEVEWAQELEPSPSPTGTGILYVLEDLNGNAHIPPLGDPLRRDDSFLGTGAALGDGGVSFLLIDSPTPVRAGHDLDTGAAGLDLPPGAELVDGIGWARFGSTDRVYGANLENGTPSHRPWDAATRFPGDPRPLEAAAWYYGQLTDESPDEPDGTAYDPIQRSANFPAQGALSPGDRNRGGAANGASPVAVGDAYTATRDTVLMRGAAEGLLVNDSDPENEILGAGVAAQPTHGAVEVYPDGSFRYTPNPGYEGPDAFAYTASDGERTLSAAVTINVQPPPPADPGPGGGSTPGGPADGGTPVAPDGLAPTFSAVSITNRTFAVNTRGRAETSVKLAAAKKGTTFRYTLSEPARVVFTIEQATTGRRVGRTCRKQTRSNRKRRKCTRYVRFGRFAQQSTAGANRKAYTGRIGRKRMKAGKYRASLVATDQAGNASAPRRINLKVVRR